jgi:serine protease Do
MPALRLHVKSSLSLLPALGIALLLSTPGAYAQNAALTGAMGTLVQVNFTTETLAPPGSVVEFGGKVITNYQPTIIGWFPASGIVIDEKGRVLTYLGYRWVDIHNRNPKIEIVDAIGRKYSGKLVGIDQNMMIAVIQCQTAGLRRTPMCERCDIKNGIKVVLPVQDSVKGAQLESAQVLSINSGNAAGGGEWAIRISRPVSLVGAPLLDGQNQVIGLVTHQPAQDPGVNARVDVVDVSILGISQILSSATKILQAGGDIQTGWLGVDVKTNIDTKMGVTIDGVAKGGPADKAGLLPGDLVTKWNGKTIPRDLMGFIHMIEDTPLGTRAAIDILRQGKPMTLTAVIEARKPQEPNERYVFDFPEVMSLPGARITTGDAQFQSSLGIEILLLTPQLAQSLQMPVSSGLLIANVNKQTAFDLAGVLAGDVILGVDGVQVGDAQSFYEHVKSRGWGSSLVLKLVRKGQQLTKTVKLPLRKIE